MNFYSDFQENKTYSYQTLSLDGTKVAHQVNIKYLFGFKEGAQSKVEQFFFSKTFMKYFKEKGITFPEDIKKGLTIRNVDISYVRKKLSSLILMELNTIEKHLFINMIKL